MTERKHFISFLFVSTCLSFSIKEAIYLSSPGFLFCLHGFQTQHAHRDKGRDGDRDRDRENRHTHTHKQSCPLSKFTTPFYQDPASRLCDIGLTSSTSKLMLVGSTRDAITAAREREHSAIAKQQARDRKRKEGKKLLRARQAAAAEPVVGPDFGFDMLKVCLDFCWGEKKERKKRTN